MLNYSEPRASAHFAVPTPSSEDVNSLCLSSAAFV